MFILLHSVYGYLSQQQQAAAVAVAEHTQKTYAESVLTMQSLLRNIQLEDEWSSIHWEKVDYMTRIGLRPW